MHKDLSLSSKEGSLRSACNEKQDEEGGNDI
jgi:hypothetical protein